MILSAIEESRQQTLDEYENTIDQLAERDWERSRRLIFEELGQHREADSLMHDTHESGFGTAGMVGLSVDGGNCFI